MNASLHAGCRPWVARWKLSVDGPGWKSSVLQRGKRLGSTRNIFTAHYCPLSHLSLHRYDSRHLSHSCIHALAIVPPYPLNYYCTSSPSCMPPMPPSLPLTWYAYMLSLSPYWLSLCSVAALGAPQGLSRLAHWSVNTGSHETAPARFRGASWSI